MSRTNCNSKKRKTRMIRWRLRVLMAEQNINNKTLAKLTGLHPTTISRLKNTDELKQISGEALDALCNALACTPNDLIAFSPDNPSPSAIVDESPTIEFSSNSERSTLNSQEKHPDFKLAA